MSVDDFDPAAEGKFLGPYRLDHVIGRGGMGSVYLAHHAKTGEEVAVKLIAQHVADDQRFRRRFDAEVETLKRLRHPGIVRLIGYGEENGRLFYSMEMVHGQSLQQRIREVKRMGWLAATDISIQICAALKHAHDIGVVHRDLKPANLLLTDAGEVKLVDFGIAKLFGFGEQTLSGSVLGTADYMAPEQAGTGKITPRTDLYAVGSVMYAMMAGRSPFSGKKITQVIESLQRDRPVPLDLINPDIPEAIVSIVHDLLEKDPVDRPPTALAVMNRLKASRVGLQRDQTVNLQSGPTKMGPPSPRDASSPEQGDAPGSGDTANTPLTDGAVRANPDRATDSTGDRQPRGKTVPKLDGGRSLSGFEEPETMDSVASTADAAMEPDPPTLTRFETVSNDIERGPHWLDLDGNAAGSSRWLTGLSIAGMILILAGGGWLFWRSIQTPSADAMHAELAVAHDAGELPLQTAMLSRFLELYPDDPRADQVRQWREQTELERTLKRLSAWSRSVGGINQLPPAEQAFVRAMQFRDQSGRLATEHLRSWLAVFDPSVVVPAGSDDGTSEFQRRLESKSLSDLAVLANQELARLEQSPGEDRPDERLAILNQKLDAAVELDMVKRQHFLRGLITLYRDVPWAESIVRRASVELTSAANERP